MAVQNSSKSKCLGCDETCACCCVQSLLPLVWSCLSVRAWPVLHLYGLVCQSEHGLSYTSMALSISPSVACPTPVWPCLSVRAWPVLHLYGLVYQSERGLSYTCVALSISPSVACPTPVWLCLSVRQRPVA